MHQRANFRVDCLNRCGDKAVFQFFKMAVRNFNCRSSSGEYASPSQILCRSIGRTVAETWRMAIFQCFLKNK